MEFTDLVHPGRMKFFRSPALHFLIIGGLLFAALANSTGLNFRVEPTQIVIPQERLKHLKLKFVRQYGRLPTPDENASILETLVDEEILYQYALRLGLQKEPVPERRLAQIAAFVSQIPDVIKSQQELATEAMDLGLHRGDFVTRRILIDAARRLIRAAVRVRQPSEEMLEAYLRNHEEEFRFPHKTRLTQVLVNQLKFGDKTEDRARVLLKKITEGSYSPAQAAKLGDQEFVSSSLPLLNDQDLARKFGQRFVQHLTKIPPETWGGPVPSRYGLHLVYVHERQNSYIPPLSLIKKKVRAHLMEQLANEWLVFRLAQLRAEFDIVMPEPLS